MKEYNTISVTGTNHEYNFTTILGFVSGHGEIFRICRGHNYPNSVYVPISIFLHGYKFHRCKLVVERVKTTLLNKRGAGYRAMIIPYLKRGNCANKIWYRCIKRYQSIYEYWYDRFKTIIFFRYIERTDSLSFKTRFSKSGPTYRRKVVYQRNQTI